MAKIIVDTSVWIDFFRGRLNQRLYGNLREGIPLGTVAITDIIKHEILVGASTLEHYRSLLRIFSPLECLRIADEELGAFDEFAWELKQKGFKGKYTDASIAFLCHHYHLPLLTFDRYFYLLAKKGLIIVL